MKLITAIVRADQLGDVMYGVSQAGGCGLTVTDVRGFGQQYGHLGPIWPAEQEALVLPKLRIDVLVNDEVAESVTDAIAKWVHTGAIGDGKIWICPVDGARRVRTGERDQDAV